LQHPNRQLESAYEEPQSTNEELETTDEELQSTNDEPHSHAAAARRRGRADRRV
jgi:hypothetical protein